ncbi:Pseudouridine-5'-phosphatase [Nowakowskiella sp. JEL0078]|nr:Pseudouridine-5'-phosphatase [Nowakowskiella sp. JEL0078]
METTHVLFDMDGLLLDTERIYSEVTQEIVAQFGKTYSWHVKVRKLSRSFCWLNSAQAKLMGLREREAGLVLVRELDLPISVDEYLQQRREGHAKKFPFCKPLPGLFCGIFGFANHVSGAVRLVSHLKKHGIPIAVATSSHKNSFLQKTENNKDLFKLFGDNITVGDDPDIKNGKPAPDIFLVAAHRLGHDSLDFKKCLVFEDAPSGVEAALNAGMTTIWVPDVNLKLDDDLKSRVAEIIYSLDQFIPEKYGLPAYD